MSGGELFSPKPFGSAPSSYRKVSSNFECVDSSHLSVQTSSLSQSSYNSSSPISSPLSGSISSPDQLVGPFVARSNTSGPPSPSRYTNSVNLQPQQHAYESQISPGSVHHNAQHRAPPAPPPKPAHPSQSVPHSGPPPPMPKPRMNVAQGFTALNNNATSNGIFCVKCIQILNFRLVLRCKLFKRKQYYRLKNIGPV